MNGSKWTVGATLAAAMLLGNLGAAEAGGRVDFGTFTPPDSGGQFVEINVGSTLINMAARLIEKDEPEVSKMIAGLRSIRVNVIGLDSDNISDIKSRAKKLGEDLAAKGWERVVAAQEKGQDVGVYLKTRAEDVIQGLTVVVLEGEKQAVFINVDGDIKPQELAMLGERMDIEPLKKMPALKPRQTAEDEK